jgi:predicted molibdopterin-dependent oxidoreductase YjgC
MKLLLYTQLCGCNARETGARRSAQWPVKDKQHLGTPILHVGQFTRGKGKFMPIEHIHRKCQRRVSMLLSTGRVLYHWHGGEMTRRARG